MGVKSRGINFELLLNYIKKVKGSDGLEEFNKALKRTDLPTEMKDIRNIKGKEWYPVEYEFEYLKVLDNTLGSGDMTRCRAYGFYSASDLGFLQYFVRWLKVSPQTIAKKAHEDWPKAYKGGNLYGKEITEDRIVMCLEDFPANEHFCENLVGLFEGVIKLTGKKGKVVHKVCTSKGGEVCDFEVNIK